MRRRGSYSGFQRRSGVVRESYVALQLLPSEHEEQRRSERRETTASSNPSNQCRRSIPLSLPRQALYRSSRQLAGSPSTRSLRPRRAVAGDRAGKTPFFRDPFPLFSTKREQEWSRSLFVFSPPIDALFLPFFSSLRETKCRSRSLERDRRTPSSGSTPREPEGRDRSVFFPSC